MPIKKAMQAKTEADEVAAEAAARLERVRVAAREAADEAVRAAGQKAKEDKKAAQEADAQARKEAAALKAEQKALKAEQKALFSFSKVQRLYHAVKAHKPKGGSTQAGWELVANDMNAAAEGPTKGLYTAKNTYECWMRWTNKPYPTGNPQLGDETEIDLLFNIKSLEGDHIVGAAAPPEALRSL